MDDVTIRALVAGLLVALVAGPLGAFIVWRRMAYFGDALSHAALLGVALGYLLGLNLGLGVIAVCATVAVLLLTLEKSGLLATDTLLGIMAHATLSLGLVVLAILETPDLDLEALLFGDVMTVSMADVYWIGGGSLFALSALLLMWRSLLALTVHEELAQVEGVKVVQVRLAFMLLIAVVIAVAMKVVGILLITSLLIIPAATARRFAGTPEQMAVLAGLFGAAGVVAGVVGAGLSGAPVGPAIVVAASMIFAVSVMISGRALQN